MIEGWQVRTGRICVVMLYPNQQGWDIFTAHDSLKVGVSLHDAEQRLRLTPEKAGKCKLASCA